MAAERDETKKFLLSVRSLVKSDNSEREETADVSS